ncbi:hypothetical protein DPMN_067462 [Dreissena polymorpha]|uniref:Uncharacterized protein n=1 Tax=Dreissena polymorpha TaxID=45954 RepID=A0A9D3YVA7_DREPO|nr:hypothetical protein DPMN_067462 [Dreissena polymorpha]
MKKKKKEQVGQGSSPVYASGSTSEEKGHYSKRTVFWSSWYLRWLQALNGAARAAEFLFLGEGFRSVGYYGRRTRQ